MKADTLFETKTFNYEPALDASWFDGTSALDESEPVSELVLALQNGREEKAFYIQFFDELATLPKSTKLPQLFGNVAVDEPDYLEIGGLDELQWTSALHLSESQESKIVIPLALSSSRSERLELSISEWTLPSGWRVFLEDVETDESTELDKTSRTEFEFSAQRDIQPMAKEIPAIYGEQPKKVDRRYQLVLYPPGTFENEIDEPATIALHQNYPNPFNPATTIAFYLPETTEIRLSVYNVVGQAIVVLEEGTLTAGEHHYEWNATGFPSGMYIYQLEVGTKILTRKMTLVK